MPIIVTGTNGKDFPLCPNGLHQAVCVDVVDLGMVEMPAFKQGEKERKVHKIRIVWQVADVDENGRPYQVSRRYTASLHEKAALRKSLESWRGRAFTEEELAGFDLEKLIGVNCQINVLQEKRQDKTYANVNSIVPAAKGAPKLLPRDYVRVKDRQPETDAPPPPHIDEQDDIPF